MWKWALWSLLLFLGNLVCARYLPDPLWQLALYPLPLLLTSVAVASAATFLEYQLGPHFRSVAPVLAAALGLFCMLFGFFERPPGTLVEGLLLENLGAKAVSIAALGAGVWSLGLAFYGARAPTRPAQIVSGVAVILTAIAFAQTARALGLPTLSTVTITLLGLSGLLYLVSLKPRAPEAPHGEAAETEPESTAAQ